MPINLKIPLYDTHSDQYGMLTVRSKEILTMIKIINRSFTINKEPPVTTTDFYKVGRMLGKGAFGKVSLAMHKLTRKLVAVKSMNKRHLN
jgi:serine/threonine protein kinase